MKEIKEPRKPLIVYYLIAMAIILILNTFIFPLFLGNRTKDVDYGTFLTMIDDKKIDTVQMESDYIYFTGKGEEKQYYRAATFEDPKLVDRLYESGCKFGRVIEPGMPPIVSFLISWIIPIGIFWLFGVYFRKKMTDYAGSGGMGTSFMQFGKSNAKVYVSSTSGTTFKDVAGQDEAKEALNEIVDILHNPGKYKQMGAALPKGALLVGPPGTGKTLLAKAVAGEANVPFFSISGSEFIEMFVGMGAAKVRDLFKQANEKAPCIVFIDEIDAIGKKRDSRGIGGNDEREQTLNQLLTEMDGFDPSKGVVILGATNVPETLDPALTRPGRFDRRIPVELPDLVGREAILAVHAKKVKMDENVDLNAIARAASGASGAELANMINEAALNAVRRGSDKVTQADLEESIEVVVAGYQKKNKILSESERKIVAYHEIGHALVSALQAECAPVTKITIVPRTSGALGYTMQVEEEEKNLLSKTALENKIATLTGGRAAEKLVFNSITTGAANDIEKATQLARSMVTRFGMSDEFGMVAFETVINPYLGGDTSMSCSPETAAKIDQKIIALVNEQYLKAESLLRGKMDKLHELAEYLNAKETITGEEFMRILNQ